MSNVSDLLVGLISDFEEEVRQMDMTAKGRTWSQNVINLAQQLEMLRNDANEEDADFLPEPLDPDFLEEQDKRVKTPYGGQNDAKALFERIEGILMISDDPEVLASMDITPEILQRWTKASDAYKVARTVREWKNATKRTQAAKADGTPIQRDLDGTITIHIVRPDGTKKDIRRERNWNSANWSLKTDQRKSGGQDAWDQMLSICTDLNESLYEASKTHSVLDETFDSISGDRINVIFTPYSE